MILTLASDRCAVEKSPTVFDFSSPAARSRISRGSLADRAQGPLKGTFGAASPGKVSFLMKLFPNTSDPREKLEKQQLFLCAERILAFGLAYGEPLA